MGGDAVLKARDGRISCFWHHTGQGLLAHMLTSLLRCLKSWSCLIWGSKYCAHILKSECQQASISPPCWVKVEYEIRCNNCLLNKNKKFFVKKQDRGAGWLVDWGCYWLVRSFTSGIYRVWQVLEPLIQWMEAAGENDSPQNNSGIYRNCTVHCWTCSLCRTCDQVTSAAGCEVCYSLMY